MELQELIDGYEEHRRRLDVEIKQLMLNHQREFDEMWTDVQEVCGKLNEAKEGYRVLDRIEEAEEEMRGLCGVAQVMLEGYLKVKDVDKREVGVFVEAYLRNLEMVDRLGMVNSKLIAEIRGIVEEQKAEVIDRVGEMWRGELQIESQRIKIASGLKTAKLYLSKIGQWEVIVGDTEKSLVEFFERNAYREAKFIIMTSHSELRVGKEELKDFGEICRSIEQFLSCFNLIGMERSEFVKKVLQVIKRIVEKQAVQCAYDPETQKKSVDSLKALESRKDAFLYTGLSDIINNCREVTVKLNKNSVLERLKKLLTGDFSTLIQKTQGSISKEADEYCNIIIEVMKSQGKSESQRLSNLYTVREAAILFMALRDVAVKGDLRGMIVFCCDSEHLIQVLGRIEEMNKEYPEHLRYLIEYSDIIALIHQHTQDFYIKITEKYNEELHEKSKLFDFSQFDENFSYQEAVLLSALKIIKRNDVESLLPCKISFRILGQLIDTLISQTVDKILTLKDIYIKDIQLLKHFFDKIFELREIFKGQSPVDFCINWEKLEALLEIIEGRLIDIIGMYERKRFNDLFTTRQLRKLIKALFEDNEKRRNALKIII